MSKIINVFINSKWFGSFTNKKNAFSAISSSVDISELVFINKSGSSVLPVSYHSLALLLKSKSYGECVGFFRRFDIEFATESTPAKPIVQVLECISNKSVTGVIYKGDDSSESSESSED
jgi:hypothetical protein